MWTPSLLLVPVSLRQEQVDQVFLEARRRLLETFPHSSVHHVGSTALAPAFTRGIVDLELAVSADKLADTQERLAASDALSALPLRVEVHLRDQQVPSRRLQIRQTFAEHPLLLGEFIGLQKQYLHQIGRGYPQAKDRFFDSLVQTAEFANAAQADDPPYHIELETSRLRLVSALSIDAEEFARYRRENRNHHERFEGPRPEEHYLAARWKKRFAEGAIECWRKEALTLLLRRKQDNQLIGACNFSGFVWRAFRTCNIGYQIAQNEEGKGYMSEAAAVAIDYVFAEWGVHRVQAFYDVSNTRSAKLAKRLGLQVEGTAKDYIHFDASWHDAVVAGLTR